jgi:hypothetical protein
MNSPAATQGYFLLAMGIDKCLINNLLARNFASAKWREIEKN